MLAVYRPGSESITNEFFDEFSTLLETLSTFNSQLLVVGDFNVHIDNVDDIQGRRLLTLISDFDLHQSVREPTHVQGHILDLVITRSDCAVKDIHVEPPSLSDHGLITFSIPFYHKRPIYSIISTRGWKNLDRDKFREVLKQSPLCGDLAGIEENSAEDLFDIYERSLRDIIDQLLPVRKVKSRYQPNSPWFDKSCREARRTARRLEKRFRRSGTAEDRSTWASFLRSMHIHFKEKECQFWEQKISSQTNSPKMLWKHLSSVLGREKRSDVIQILPSDLTLTWISLRRKSKWCMTKHQVHPNQSSKVRRTVSRT